MDALRKRLETLAKDRGLTVVDRGNGHLQITGGPLLVNYWPDSRRRSVYIAGMTEAAKHHAMPEQVIEFCFAVPKVQQYGKRDKRGSSSRYKTARKRLYRQSTRCHWCGVGLTLLPHLENSATLDHVIPLALGGLDNANNWVLACEKCNHDRGSEMPELKKARMVNANE